MDWHYSLNRIQGIVNIFYLQARDTKICTNIFVRRNLYYYVEYAIVKLRVELGRIVPVR